MNTKSVKETTTRKRWIKLIAFVCLILMASLLLSSCGGKKGLTGTWEALGGHVTLVFRDDGTYTASSYTFVGPGSYEPRYKYTSDDNSFTMFYDMTDYENNRWEGRVKYTYRLDDNGDTLSIVSSQESFYKNGAYENSEDSRTESIVYTRKK